MSEHSAFELLREQQIPEVNSLARLYRHRKTGAEVLSLANDDENKVFGITFKTPPEDSTGVAHILEHSVLCGSRKYPVKKPFVELLKGSLHTFLNAMTFSDKTAYPVASQNLQDFYNLVDVYLDAVFFPLISEDTFRQEGWHYELEATQGPIVYKGVVFNEMKGAYSSPAAVLAKASQLSLYPDTTYGVNSGGDPKAIPDLTYDYFKNFHEKFYHPSNSRIVFYGDDDPAERLSILDNYLGQFDRIEVKSEIALQKRFDAPKKVAETYAASADEREGKGGMVTVNWMLDPVLDQGQLLRINILEQALVNTSASPLRKALIDSRLGEGMTGSGFAEGPLQPYWTVGLKGIDPADADKVEELILSTLASIERDGLDPKMIEAAVNTMEFGLRENNTGSFPRGIALMFRSMSTWLHDGDPLAPLSFETHLQALKDELAAGKKVFEPLIRELLLDNPHRTTVLLTPDPEQGAREASEEKARLETARAVMTPEALAEVADTTKRLKALQEEPDPAEALARIPTLGLADLPRTNKPIPIERDVIDGVPVYTHPLATSGVIYLDLAFDLYDLPGRLLPYVPVFIGAVTSTGTSKEDFVSMTQRIGRSTGGVGANKWASTKRDGTGTAARLFFRGKAVPDKAEELLDILVDLLTDAQLGNRERIKQMVFEAKAGFESSLAGMGNSIAASRLKSQLNPADWFGEQMGGVTQYFFMRDLAARIDRDWDEIEARLVEIRDFLLTRRRLVANVTADDAVLKAFHPQLGNFLRRLPQGSLGGEGWGFVPRRLSEGLTFPGQVNYVAKGGDLTAHGVTPTGGMAVALKHLNTTYMWDKIRVQGGAYGGGAGFDMYSGSFVFTSYRDPNLLETLANYDGAAAFLRHALGEQELTRSIIGVIGSVDAYRLPDAKGYASLIWELVGETDETRQKRREEILGATQADFEALADGLDRLASDSEVVVLGSETAIRAANEERGKFLELVKVL